MKSRMTTVIVFLLAGLGIPSLSRAEIIEEVYAVINDEIITLSELRNAELHLRQELSRKFSGEELSKEITEQKAQLLERLIENKLVLSKAREKNYDVESDIEIWIKGIKEENNYKNDEELKLALAQQGLTWAEFKEQLRIQRMQQKLLYEEAYSNINIDNSRIMEYYRDHIEEHTIPQKISLNCIFLNKENYVFENMLKEKKEKVLAELTDKNFKEIAAIYSELPGGENKYYLGEFNKGELDLKLEEAALALKPGETSGWLETENGWYIIQVVSITEAKLIDYKEVRDKIKEKLSNIEREKELKKFLQKLKAESYIKIYKEF